MKSCNRRPYYRRDPLTDEEYDSLSLGNRMLGYFLDRRRVDHDEPKPSDDGPTLRIVE